MNQPWLQPLLGLVEIGSNRLLDLDPGSAARCSALNGSIIGIELTDLSLSIYCHPGNNGLRISLQTPGREPDAWIRGRLIALASLSMNEDKVSTSIQERIEISGNARVAQKFQKLLQELNIDWEEQLSRLTGDVMAFRISQLSQTLREQGKSVFESLTQSTSEYLQHESRALPSYPEYEGFRESVTQLHHDVERLEAKIALLSKR